MSKKEKNKISKGYSAAGRSGSKIKKGKRKEDIITALDPSYCPGYCNFFITHVEKQFH
jgi:hypothetical protein